MQRPITYDKRFVPTPKEKWVINKLQRDGFILGSVDYSDEEMFLWRQVHPPAPFDWCGNVLFYIGRKTGCRLEYRPSHSPALHLHWYLSWPNTKNWQEIDNFIKLCQKIEEGSFI